MFAISPRKKAWNEKALKAPLIRWNDPAASVLPTGIILSIVTAGLLGFGGWHGGELAYRHKIGVIEHEKPNS